MHHVGTYILMHTWPRVSRRLDWHQAFYKHQDVRFLGRLSLLHAGVAIRRQRSVGLGVPSTNWIPDPSDSKDDHPLVGFYRWNRNNGSDITVKFVESKSDKILGKIKENAALWSEYANITCKFVNGGDAMIRIPSAQSKVSYLIALR